MEAEPTEAQNQLFSTLQEGGLTESDIGKLKAVLSSAQSNATFLSTTYALGPDDSLKMALGMRF